MQIKETQLQNGWKLHYRSKYDLKILTREFLEDDIYGRNGIELKDGDTIFDVGANIGVFLCWLGNSLKHANVHCFEPIPDTYEVLEKNAEVQSHLNVELQSSGLSNEKKTATFDYNPSLSVAASMKGKLPENKKNSREFVVEEIKARSRLMGVAFDYTPRFIWWPLLEGIRVAYKNNKQVTCSLDTMSNYIKQYNVERIDLLKIDVEGAEEDVMEGMSDEDWGKVKQVVMETHLGLEQAERIQEKLHKLGFETRLDIVVPGVEHLHLLTALRK